MKIINKNKLRKNIFQLFLLQLFIFNGCTSAKLANNIKMYQLHLEDLSFIDANGYKNNFDSMDVQGSIHVTNNNLDCAIIGLGFFKFSKENDSGFFYSRDGAFKINRDGFIVNKDGFYLEPKVQLPADVPILSVFINTNGELILEKTNSLQVLQKFSLYNFTDGNYSKKGNYYFSESARKMQKADIIGGALETANYFVRTKLYNMLAILYELKQLKPNNKEYYNFRINLIEQLLLSYRELNRKLDEEKNKICFANKTSKAKQIKEPLFCESQNNIDDYVFYQNFYAEVKETIKFLSFEKINN